MTLTKEYVSSILKYDPETGLFYWRNKKHVKKEYEQELYKLIKHIKEL